MPQIIQKSNRRLSSRTSIVKNLEFSACLVFKFLNFLMLFYENDS